MAGRALQIKMCLYRHALVCHKLFDNIFCENEFMHLNFQFSDNERLTKLTFIKWQNYDVGKNILLNRMLILNNLIDKQWLELSLNSFKIKCKENFCVNLE